MTLYEGFFLGVFVLGCIVLGYWIGVWVHWWIHER